MRRDLDQYVWTMQKKVEEAKAVVDKVNKDIENGFEYTDDQIIMVQNMYLVANSNLDRVLYIIWLLKKPPKFIQKLQEKKMKREQEKFAKQLADLEAVKAETEKVIEEAKENIDGRVCE